jgi:peroxidase
VSSAVGEAVVAARAPDGRLPRQAFLPRQLGVYIYLEVGTRVCEKTASPNANYVCGYDVIDTIKMNVEGNWSGVVSCADIFALTARDGVVQLGGPSWDVPIGRRDATTASLNEASSDLPGPSSELATLVAAFGDKGLRALVT